MQSENARLLIEAITNATNVAVDAKNRITVLEKAIQDHDPALYQSYLGLLDMARSNPPTSLNPAALTALQSKLAQD